MDPGAGGGIGKAAQELMQEMQKAQQEAQKAQEQQQAQGPNQQFEQTMQAQQANDPTQVNQVNSSQKVQETQKASNVLLQAKVDGMTPSTRVGSAAKAERSKMASMIEGLVQGQDKMTHIMNQALSGRQFSPPELLAMQAGVYRFSQEMELTSKVIEKATSGIKQTMNTQL